MSRKPGTWRTTKGYSILNKSRDAVIRRALAGETLTSIAKRYGTTTTNLCRWLKTTDIYDRKIKCVLVECQQSFDWRPGKLACCRKHIKRYNGRGCSAGNYLPCSLPECDKLVLVAKRKPTRLWWCSSAHYTAHTKRVRTGYYRRIVGSSPAVCYARSIDGASCGERLCLDKHHVVWKGSTSDKASNTVWLCPTHHLAIHRKFAGIEEGVYVWYVDKIREGLAQKHPQLAARYRR